MRHVSAGQIHEDMKFINDALSEAVNPKDLVDKKCKDAIEKINAARNVYAGELAGHRDTKQMRQMALDDFDDAIADLEDIKKMLDMKVNRPWGY